VFFDCAWAGGNENSRRFQMGEENFDEDFGEFCGIREISVEI
jgi:hypothetical protein